MLNLILVAFLAICAAFIGPALDESQDQADALQQAQLDARHAERFDTAARAVCGGPESSYIQLEKGVIQCVTKRGHKTLKAHL
jgi:hypothetical protein